MDIITEQRIRKLIQEELKNLSYDEMDLDFFTRNYLVGRWFETAEEALKYLNSVIQHSDGKTIDDYIISKQSGGSLKEFQIHPKPTQEQYNRNEASNFIKKYGMLSSPNTRYVTYPLAAYVEYKYVNKLKELGVYYKFEPLKNISFESNISKFIKQKTGYANSIQQGRIQFFGLFDQDKTKAQIKEIQNQLKVIVNEFNSNIGTDYYLEGISGVKSSRSEKQHLLNMLDDIKYPAEPEHQITYKNAYFGLKRGNDEEEFLAVVPMESLDKPQMVNSEP